MNQRGFPISTAYSSGSYITPNPKISRIFGFLVRIFCGIGGLLVSLWSSHAAGETVVLDPSRDNTIYEESGSDSSGNGAFFFSGKLGPHRSEALRRALLFFDIVNGDGQNAGIPAGSTINDVTLTLHISRSRPGNQSMAVHKLTQDWGEEGSFNAGFGGTGGKGGNAQTNDATWTHRFFDTPMTWMNLGGDFESSASDTASVGESGDATWSSAQMIADVQDWLDNPISNSGWILIGNESTQKSAKRFNSRQNGNNRPTLTIDFTPAGVPTTFTVNSNDDVDDGLCDTTHCSLREGIHAANSTTAADTIAFNIPGSGPHTIQTDSDFPIITEPVIIDGYTQSGASRNTNPPEFPINAVLKIELDGSNAGGSYGLFISAADCTVLGLVINRFGSGGIRIEGPGIRIIQGNFIGTDVTGSAALGNGLGVEILSAADNLIGGLQAAARNLISGNNGYGIYIDGIGATGNVVQGNFIGTDVTGTVDLGNGGAGVEIRNAPNNSLGGSQPGARNLISGNDFHGIRIWLPDAIGNLVQGNFIGTDLNGTGDIGNVSAGVAVSICTSMTRIGGIGPGESNVIAFNDNGVLVIECVPEAPTTSNSIRGNSIFRNGSLGIDLGADGVSPNDDLDGDTGPNNLQNFPVLSYSTLGLTRIVGALNSAPIEEFDLDFYASSSVDASNSDEGERYLGSAIVMTDGSGEASFDITFSEFTIHGEYITATATDSSGNTSEFSPAVMFNDGTLDSWRSDRFDQVDLMDPAKEASVWGDSANPDGDTLTNLIEYFMGFDPLVNDGDDAIEASVDENGLSLSYRKSKVTPEAVGQVEWSTNLLDWFSSDITEVVVEDLGEVEVIEATVPINAGESEKFMRLRVDSQ